MHSFPLTVLDNFFDDPDEVRRLALAQEYEKDPAGMWPGLRSRPLHTIHPIFFEQMFTKLFALFYKDPRNEVMWEITALFQKVDDNYGSGWIHTDSVYTNQTDNRQTVMSGIIYLTPDTPLNSGTSLYRLKKGVLAADITLDRLKQMQYNGDLTKEAVEDARQIYNNQFEETVKVSSVYNRLIAFEANQLHAAQTFFGEGDQSRLTLVFFVNKFLSGRSPVQRMRHLL